MFRLFSAVRLERECPMRFLLAAFRIVIYSLRGHRIYYTDSYIIINAKVTPSVGLHANTHCQTRWSICLPWFKFRKGIGNNGIDTNKRLFLLFRPRYL